MSSAIWKAIPSASPKRAERRVAAAAEQAGGLEQLPGLERAALEVGLDASCPGRASARRCSASPRASASVASARHRDGLAVAGRGELGEGPREEIVAGGARGLGAVGRPGGRAAAPVLGAWSIRSSCTSVAMWTSSTAAPAASGGSRRAARRGRPAAAAGACRRPRALRRRPRRRVPECDSTAPARRSSSSSRYSSRPGVLANGREAHAATPDVERHDPAGERAPADVLEAGSAQEAGELVGAGEAAHAGGKVRVRRAAGKDLSEQRHEAGRTRAGRRARAARCGFVISRIADASARPQHAPQLGERRARGRRGCGRRSRPSPRRSSRPRTAAASASPCTHVDLARLAPRALEHARRRSRAPSRSRRPRSAATARSPVPQQASSTRSPGRTTASTVARRQRWSSPIVIVRFITS